ncbi:unnamed protein product, partial [Soboliphyme baturini]|uniref:LysR family transcriptional regulator n=1 Tax=Soboliphyme baturini TaxID=241478 RepID=A0A183IW56_9BILA
SVGRSIANVVFSETRQIRPAPGGQLPLPPSKPFSPVPMLCDGHRELGCRTSIEAFAAAVERMFALVRPSVSKQANIASSRNGKDY